MNFFRPISLLHEILIIHDSSSVRVSILITLDLHNKQMILNITIVNIQLIKTEKKKKKKKKAMHVPLDKSIVSSYTAKICLVTQSVHFPLSSFSPFSSFSSNNLIENLPSLSSSKF